MAYISSWRFWLIVVLAFTTLACAGRAERRERREDARQERLERREQARQERAERQQRSRAERNQGGRQEAAADPAPPVERQTAAASFTPVAAPMAATAAAADASSKVIFMRVSKQSSSTNAALFDVTEPGAPKYIGTVNSATKLSYSLSPGLYTFMAVGETAEFMQATVVGGKTYYALVIPRANATRFSLEPVRQNELGGKEFSGWDRGTKMASSGAQQSYNASDAADKRQRYWSEWSKKSETQRAELTLNAEDGK
jgi:hypothetical protein